MTPDDSPAPDSAPHTGVDVAGGGDVEPSLRDAWARSGALTYVVILSVAAFAIGLGWPLVEWAFDARRLFR